MNALHDEPDDSTPLTLEEREGLIPSHVTLRRELNELEQQNIFEADTWALQRRHDFLHESFGRRLHRRMFGKVWPWAGKYRATNKNLGIDKTVIQPRLYKALDDAKFWMENKTFAPDESAVRFHHALVSVHPFPNGNGRWSRLMGDIMVTRFRQHRFSWGGGDLRDADKVRKAYIEALHAADRHEFELLIAFARS